MQGLFVAYKAEDKACRLSRAAPVEGALHFLLLLRALNVSGASRVPHPIPNSAGGAEAREPHALKAYWRLRVDVAGSPHKEPHERTGGKRLPCSGGTLSLSPTAAKSGPPF